MVVEDEPAIQDLIACNLDHAGHVPLRADSAEQALERVRGSLPYLMLVDWMLPGASGMELTRRLRADRRTGDIPIIMLTARGEERDKLAGLESVRTIT
jgi:two-component system phosphate regulon response regulator PhoB